MSKLIQWQLPYDCLIGPFILWIVVAVGALKPSVASAQVRLAGHVDAKTHHFVPKDTHYEVFPAVEGLELVRFHERWGVIASDGTWIAKPDQKVAFVGLDSLLGVEHQEDRKMGAIMIEQSGLNVRANSICSYGNGGTYFLVWEDGSLVVPYRLMVSAPGISPSSAYQRGGRLLFRVYDPLHAADPLLCSRCKICVSGVGMVNGRGEILVNPNRYFEIGPFQEGLAVAKAPNGKYGFIDLEGVEVIACQYDYAENFEAGKARVWRGQEQVWIDVVGNVIP